MDSRKIRRKRGESHERRIKGGEAVTEVRDRVLQEGRVSDGGMMEDRWEGGRREGGMQGRRRERWRNDRMVGV